MSPLLRGPPVTLCAGPPGEAPLWVMLTFPEGGFMFSLNKDTDHMESSLPFIRSPREETSLEVQ